MVRIFSAQTVRWRGIFASHNWIVINPAGAPSYTRYDHTAWSDPIRTNGFEPDGCWFGHAPILVFAAHGGAAQILVPPVCVQGGVADSDIERLFRPSSSSCAH